LKLVKYICHNNTVLTVMTACRDLLDGIEGLPTMRKIVRITHVLVPRLFNVSIANCPEREESVLAVRHVEVLSAEEKPPHDRKVCVTVHHHCVTYQTS